MKVKCGKHRLSLWVMSGVFCLAGQLCFIACEGAFNLNLPDEKVEKIGETTSTATASTPETGTTTNPEPATPHPRTFDYAALAEYKTVPNSLLVDSMPADLRAKLNACLYTGPLGSNGWYADAEMESATNTAAQAFFTAMAQYVNTTGGADDFLKIQMIHDWIIDYLDYDRDVSSGRLSRDRAEGSQSATDILRRGRNFSDSSNGTAVCQGYAALFRAFMEKLTPLDNNITWHGNILGWTGNPSGPFAGFSTDGVPTNHEWNQVMINGIKFIVDCTLDDPVYGGSGSSYLFPNPSEYIYRSIPKYNSEQLLDDDGQAPWDSHVVTWEQYRRRYRP